jgi:hypothetical protein
VEVTGEAGIRVGGIILRAYYVPPAFATAGHWELTVRLDEQPLETEPEDAA